MRLVSAFVGLAFALFVSLWARAEPAGDDPFVWLEDVDGARALEWVRGQNQFTLKLLATDADYADTLDAAEQILQARELIPYGELAAGYVYNFWQGRAHARGVWRRTTLEQYQSDAPAWETLIDLDALSLRQNENWAWRGAVCLPPAYARCLIKLSRGREAVVVREFDVPSRTFVRAGFDIAEAKTEVAWVDINTIMLATNWGRGTLTAGGAPRFVKVLLRGQPVADARTLVEGRQGDVAVAPFVAFDAGRPERFIVRTVAGSNAELYWVDPNWRIVRVTTPAFAVFRGMHRRQLLFSLKDNWRTGARVFVQGSLVAFSLDRLLSTGGAIPEVKSLFAPNARSAIADVVVSRDAVYVSLLDNVKGRVHELTFDGTNWSWRAVALPDNGAVSIASASPVDREVMFKYESFLIPDRLYLMQQGDDPEVIKEIAPRFDAYAFEVGQFEAVSADGTRIPYYFVRKEETLANGKTPTLLYAYGGFEISTTPWYWSAAGKLWLEKGGAYAIANVRGGGEFGPRWHDGAKGANRQRSFDDLAAVARSMIQRGFTSPRRLGLIGASHGGLLVTGAFVQNPGLFTAVTAQVPLTDMLRYRHMSAGPSWIAEYGDPANPRMRPIIARWSPYQNLRPGVRYPRAFFLTSTRGDPVHPGHARKMAAKMRAFGQPYYYFEQSGGPRAAAGNASQRAEQLALIYTYFRQQLMD